jgi:hypothetical protein
MIISDPVCYSMNSISMGDVIAAAPIIKYAIETYHKNTDYKVLVRPYYWDIFKSFIPEDKLGDQSLPFTFHPPWQIRYLNTPRSTNARTTSMHMHLSTFASIQFLNRLIDVDYMNYLPLPKVDVSHFNLNLDKSVLIIVTYRDEVRKISFDTVAGIAEWVKSRGLIPVYIGKVDASEMWKDSPFKLSFDSLPEGVDLLNKTSLLEMASIMARSRAVVGLDSGPIHVAGTTSVPIVCGFTNVDPKHREPIRKKGIFIPITPEVECAHCQSNWWLNYYDFGFCYFKHADCLKQMTATKFISALESIGL